MDDNADNSKVEYTTTGEDENWKGSRWVGRLYSYLRRGFHAAPCMLENLELSVGERLLGGAVGRRHADL